MVTVQIYTVMVACPFNIFNNFFSLLSVLDSHLTRFLSSHKSLEASISNSSFRPEALISAQCSGRSLLILLLRASISLFDQWVQSCCSGRRRRSCCCLGRRSLLLRSSPFLTLSDLYRRPSLFLINEFLDFWIWVGF